MSTPFKRTIKEIVIHHMGDGRSPDVPIAQRWNPYKYDYPEYDFGVEADGTIRVGRILTVQGAHCIADKPQYSKQGEQWWNQNSIGIAGDFTKFTMPQAQFNGLVGLVKRLMSQYGLTLDNVYPHGQVKYTDCPGCTYSKVPALTKGTWSYDDFESAVLAPVVVAPPVVPPTPVVVAPVTILYRVILDGIQTIALASQDNAIAEMKKSVDAGNATKGTVQRTDGIVIVEYTKPIVTPVVVVVVAPVIDKETQAVDLLNQAINILKEGK